MPVKTHLYLWLAVIPSCGQLLGTTSESPRADHRAAREINARVHCPAGTEMVTRPINDDGNCVEAKCVISPAGKSPSSGDLVAH